MLMPYKCRILCVLRLKLYAKICFCLPGAVLVKCFYQNFSISTLLNLYVGYMCIVQWMKKEGGEHLTCSKRSVILPFLAS